MFDLNLKPLPGFASTLTRNPTGSAYGVNPMFASSPSVVQNETVRNSRPNPPFIDGFGLGGGSSLFFNPPSKVSESTSTINLPQVENNSQNLTVNNDKNIIDKDAITFDNMEWARSLFSEIQIKENSDRDIVVILRDKKIKNPAWTGKNYIESSEILLSDDTNKDRVVRTGITRDGDVISEIFIPSSSTVLFSLSMSFETITELEDTFNKGKQDSQFSIKSFNLHAIGIYFAIVKAYKDVTEIREPQEQKKPNSTFNKNSKNADILSFDPNPPLDCFSHDYKCSLPAADKIHVDFLWCGFDVDLSECCKQHDIDLWCGAGLPFGTKPDLGDIVGDALLYQLYYAWYTAVNAKFGACVTGKFISSASDLPWYCGGPIGGFIIGFITGVIAGAVHFIGVQIGGIGNIPSLNKYMPWDSRHKRSCLCSGAESTVYCNEPCRDLCMERGLKQNCSDCYWRCEGQGIGAPPIAKLFSLKYGADASKCCVKTREGCLDKILCKKDCFDCKHLCETTIDGRKIFSSIYGSETEVNLPCCAGTPNLEESEKELKKCDIKGTSFLPRRR